MSLSIKEEEQLSEKLKELPVFYNKTVKGRKEQDTVNYAWRSVAETLDLDGN